MKKNRISPLKGAGQEDTANHNSIEHIEREKIENLYKEEYEEEFRKLLDDKSYDEVDKYKSICDRFKNIVNFPHLLCQKFHDFNDSAEKVGFYSGTASYHYFYYSVVLFTCIIFLILRQNLWDTLLMLRLFGSGFPMILIATSLLQTLFCLFTLVAGIYSLRSRTFCALKVYLVFITLNALMIISNMSTSYYFSQESVVYSYIDTYMTEDYHHHSHRSNSKELNNFLAVTQKQFDCCGVSGPTDYSLKDNQKVIYLPLSCCAHDYQSISKAVSKFCYFIANDHHLRTRRDKLMRKIVNSQGCLRRIRDFLRRRNKFELLLTIFLLTALVLLTLCAVWFWKHLRVVICEEQIRKELNTHKTAKKFWGRIRSEIFGKEHINTKALNLLRKGIHQCNTKGQIREFLSKCVDARELLVTEKPMELAEDILADNAIPGLRISLTHDITITKSEEYEVKMAGSTSVTAMHVRDNQAKVLEKSRANIQTLLHEDYWIEEKGPKRRKVVKMPPVDKKCSAENIPRGPCPTTSSIHPHHKHVHRKSLIQLQLQRHILREQRLVLAKLIGEYQEVQFGIESRKIKYALSHKDVPIADIIALDLEKISQEPVLHTLMSIKDTLPDEDDVKVLVGPPKCFMADDEDLSSDERDEQISSMLPKTNNLTNASKKLVSVSVKRGETYTLLSNAGVGRQGLSTVAPNKKLMRRMKMMSFGAHNKKAHHQNK